MHKRLTLRIRCGLRARRRPLRALPIRRPWTKVAHCGPRVHCVRQSYQALSGITIRPQQTCRLPVDDMLPWRTAPRLQAPAPADASALREVSESQRAGTVTEEAYL